MNYSMIEAGQQKGARRDQPRIGLEPEDAVYDLVEARVAKVDESAE